MNNTLKVGSPVYSKFGHSKIKKIELCEKQGEKYGIDIKEIPFDLADRCIFDLDNGHWSYGYDLDYIPF
jgi:hypothetical protein